MNRKMATYFRFGPVVALLAIMLAVALLPFSGQPRPAEAALTAGFTVTLVTSADTDTVNSYSFGVVTSVSFDDANTLTVTFPAGTSVPTGTLTATGTTIEGVTVTSIVGTTSSTAPSVLLTAGDITAISGTGTIDVVIGTAAGIKNPAVSSDALKLSVKTSIDTTAVLSAAYRVGVLIVASPTAAGDLAEYTFTFNVSANVPANTGEIRITWDKDTQIPASISRANVLISANRLLATDSTSGTSGANQVVSVLFDPTFDTDTGDPNRKVLILKVPDMNPATTAGNLFAEGAQGIAADATVTVTFTTGAGVKNESEKATSAFDFIVRATAGGANVVSPASKGGVAITSKIILSSVDGARGTTVTVSGQGFNDKTAVTVWLDNPGGTSDGSLGTGEVKLAENIIVGADDRFTTTFIVSAPPFVPGKKNTIAVVDGEGRKADGTLPTFELRGQVTVTPTSAALGDTITFALKDFDTSSELSSTTPLAGYAEKPKITLGGITVTIPDSTSTDANGEKTFTATIPNGVSLGVQTVRVLNFCCLKGGGESSTRSTNITVTGAVITLTPTTVVPNQTISIIGRGYTEGGAATINKASDNSVLSIGGSHANLHGATNVSGTTEDETAASSKIAEGAEVKIDNGGNWSASVVVPINDTTTTEGTHQLKVIDSGGREGVVSLVIAKRTLKLTPVASRLGTIVQVSGVGYPADNTKTGAAATPAVSIKYTVGTTERIVATLTPDASGNISGSFTVPLDASIPSTNAVKAEYTKPAGGLVTVSGIHDIPKAEITVSPASGPSGTSVKIAAIGYKSFSTVTEMTIGDIDVRPAPVPATDGSGAFSTTALVPQLNTGVQTINVKVGGTTASASFIVTTAPVAPPAPAVVAAVAPAAALAPLGANLVRVWGYDAPTQKFQLHDPAAALLSDLTLLKRGGGYWINVKAAQKVTLGTFEYDLSAGWNNVGWQG
jgi:hypothetical protein